MKKSIINKLLMVLMVLAGSSAAAITAPEVFTDGTRAFNSGRWQECEEIFAKFITTWPEHKLKPEALFYQTISSTRNAKMQSDQLLKNMAASWTQNLSFLKSELPGKNLSEIEVAIDFACKETPAQWSAMDNLSEEQLKHYLSRGWTPAINQFPIDALQWAHRWLKKHTTRLNPETIGNLSLIKSLALWQIAISPLSNSANSNILKVCECWPVHTALEKELRTGFANGNQAVKREIALIGYHYEHFKHKGIIRNDSPPVKNQWSTYLQERGINLKEAWCPR